MSSKNKRRSNSVENVPDSGRGLGSGLKMYNSTTNLKPSVLNRPGTIAALSALSVGGFSQNISANALRNAHSQWSFSKAKRFKDLKFDNTPKMLLLPSTLNAKTSTFGYGNKEPLKMIFGKDSPPPTLYRSRSQFDYTPGAGKTIGQSYAVYKKVHMPGLNTRSNEIPGPGTYEQKTTLGANSLKFSLKSRIKAADSATRDNPPPNNYSPTHCMTEENKFEKITFGFGSRPNVTGRINENPGPGTYRIPSVFDKFKKIPNASLLKTLEKYRKQTRRKIVKPAQSERSSTKGIRSELDQDDGSEENQAPLPIQAQEEIEKNSHPSSVTNE